MPSRKYIGCTQASFMTGASSVGKECSEKKQRLCCPCKWPRLIHVPRLGQQQDGRVVIEARGVRVTISDLDATVIRTVLGCLAQ